MDYESAKLIAGAIAVLPLFGVGLGLGKYFAAIVEAVGRNPGVEPILKKTNLVYFALIEAVAIFALGISLLILKG
jgi:F0F1-type ATP synthase membrane subunit c/vacuolar-type H+-ATPase subunit K